MKDYQKVAEGMMQHGIHLVLTGHQHLQDIAQYRKVTEAKTDSLIDISTGATVSYPNVWRTITVNRDSSFAGDDDSDGRAFTWYKIFTAVPAEDFESSNASGHNNGVANVATGDGQVSYYATAPVAKALESEENVWFDVQAISGSDLSVITWKEGVATDATTLQAAAKWLVDNDAYEATGDMDFAIVIRTMVLEDGVLTMRAGAGIVADSDPEKEFEECLNKAKSSLKALELAQEGEL